MNGLSAVVLILRRFRTEIGILLLLFVLIGMTSFLFAAAPRLFNRVSDDAMRYAAANALPVDRDVWLYAEGAIGPGSDGGVAAVEEYGQQREQDFPPSIESLISNRFQGITSVRFAVPQSIVVMSLRYQDGLTDDATLTEGRWPVDRGSPLEMVPVGRQQDPNSQAAPTVFEVALSTTEADAIGVHVGDHLNLALDGSDPLIPKTVFVIAPTEVEVVGLFEPNNSTGAEWLGSGLLQPTLTQGPDGPSGIHATAYIPATSYSQVAASKLPFHFDWHFQLDPQRLDADQVESLQTGLQRLNLIVAPTDTRFMQDLSASVNVDNARSAPGYCRSSTTSRRSAHAQNRFYPSRLWACWASRPGRPPWSPSCSFVDAAAVSSWPAAAAHPDVWFWAPRSWRQCSSRAARHCSDWLSRSWPFPREMRRCR